MNKFILAFSIICCATLSACVGPVDADGVDSLPTEEGGARAMSVGSGEGVRPFHVAMFDGRPTEDEIELELSRFISAMKDLGSLGGLEGKGVVSPISFTLPSAGQKLVRLDVVTSNITNAGTDSASKVRFTGIWQADSAQQYMESFILDNPNADNLNRNTTNVFYYLLNLNTYVSGTRQDRFVEGKISNTSTDGWHCAQIVLTDRNFAGAQRTQSLPFNQWVDASESDWKAGNATSTWLSYY